MLKYYLSLSHNEIFCCLKHIRKKIRSQTLAVVTQHCSISFRQVTVIYANIPTEQVEKASC